MRLNARAREDNAPRLNRLTTRFDVRAVKDTGEFEGWASTFNDVDDYGSAMAPGCFARSIAEHTRDAMMPALLWQHDVRMVPGRILKLEERDKGLWLEGRCELDTQLGREAYALLKPDPTPALNGLSVGFSVYEGGAELRGGVLVFTAVDLWEVSLCTFPANENARIETVRAAESVRTERDLERLLRDSGLSRRDATVVASNFQPKQRDAAADPTQLLAQLLAAVRG